MTSVTSRDDVQGAIWRAGVKDPRKVDELLRVIDSYAYGLARRAVQLEEAVPGEPHQDGRALYLCRGCGDRLPLSLFPQDKQLNPAHPYDCLGCGGKDRKEYLCQECGQHKPLSEFPEEKRLNPRLRTPCSYCAPRKITLQDAGHRKR